jgi:hypothetical protein
VPLQIVSMVRAPFHAARPVGGVLLAVVAAVVATGVRYRFIEPEALGAACEGGGPWWCAPRTLLIVATELGAFGMLALAAAVAALLIGTRRHAYSAHAALLVGGAGLILYNATFSGIAVVLALLTLAFRRESSP